ncbi:uncharacterized protein [Montipora foliosa]|uniref:uncharacterized protein isoform X4 n=1 Tax=Montipora foliosa TaxID=591990 RepID=UPI0035F10A6E
MSAGDITLKPSVLSAELWSIVNKDDTDQFPKAVQIAIKLFQILPNLISVNSFCDLILDLKIKAFISTMSEEMDFNHAKASSLLNSLFPSIEEGRVQKFNEVVTQHVETLGDTKIVRYASLMLAMYLLVTCWSQYPPNFSGKKIWDQLSWCQQSLTVKRGQVHLLAGFHQ